jgi:hypothetical protein
MTTCGHAPVFPAINTPSLPFVFSAQLLLPVVLPGNLPTGAAGADGAGGRRADGAKAGVLRELPGCSSLRCFRNFIYSVVTPPNCPLHK